VKFSKGSKSEKCSSSLPGKRGESRGLLKYQGFPSQNLPQRYLTKASRRKLKNNFGKIGKDMVVWKCS